MGGGEEGEPPLPTQNRGFRAPEGRGFEEGAGLPRVSASEGGEGSEDPPIDPNVSGHPSVYDTPPPPLKEANVWGPSPSVDPRMDT